MAEVGKAFLSILPSAKGFGRSLETSATAETRTAGQVLGKAAGVAFKTSLIAAAGVGLFLKGALAEGREAQKMSAATAQIIKTTGGVANVTADQVGKLATAISLKTGIDDEAIQSGSNLILTFKNVRNEVGKGADIFDRATQAAIDLSSLKGMSGIEGSAKALGKSLQDPIKGIAALSRGGITFTDQQKATIKSMVDSGNILGAQKLVLGEVEGQVGGLAAAQATFGEKARVAYDNVREAIGTALIPVVDKMEAAFVRATPAIINGVSQIGPLFQRASKFVRPAVAIIATVLRVVIAQVRLFAASFKTNVIPVVKQAAATFKTQVIPALQRFAGFVTANVVPALIKIGGQIRSTVLPALSKVASFVLSKVVPVLVKFGTFVATNLLAPLLKFGLFLATNIIPAIAAVIGFFIKWQGVILPIVAAVVAMMAAYKAYQLVLITVTVVQNAFAAAMLVLRGVLLAARLSMAAFNLVVSANPVGILILLLVGLIAAIVVAYKRSDTFRAVVDAAFSGIKKVVSAVIGFIVPFVKNHWKLLVSIIGGPVVAIAILVATHFGTIKKVVGSAIDFVVGTAKKVGAFAKAVGQHVADVAKFFKELPGKIKDFLAKLPDQLKTIGGQIIEGLKKGIEGAAHFVTDAVQKIVDAIPKKIRSLMHIGSPSKVTEELGGFVGDGFAKGISDKAKKVKDATKKLIDAATDTLKSRLSTLRDTLASISSSVTDNLTGNLFESTTAGDFITSLTAKKAELTQLMAAFKTLRGFGLSAAFLSQLFANGGAPLILDLANSGQGAATQAAALFGDVTQLGSQLGDAVGQNDVGAKISETNHLLRQLIKATGQQAVELAQAVQHPAKHARRRAVRA